MLLTAIALVYWFDPRDGTSPTRSHISLSAQKLDGNSAHLSVRLDDLIDVGPVS